MPETQVLTDCDYRSLSAFRYQIRRFLHFSEEAAKTEGLEPQQHQMLLAIRGLEEPSAPPTVGQLAEYLFIRHHSAVGMIDRLAERGLVERLRGGEDRRQVRVRLTPAGCRKLHHLSRIHREELRQSGPALVETLRGLLEQRA
ncbi:MAG TPA: MarR family transcriptional regulator [Bryobacteraceae bacterium]|nr:MarR family transcriptional regulator [Bryobacteraceae bacterium]